MSIPYMPFYTSRYLGDTHQLTTLEHGAYSLLLFTMWDRGGALEFDLDKLRKVTRLSKANWKKVWPEIEGYFSVSDGQISQKFLAETHKVVSQKRKTLSENGKKGGRPKSLKTKDRPKANGSDLLKQPKPKPDISLSSRCSERDALPSEADQALEVYHEFSQQLERQFGKRVWPRVEEFTRSRQSQVIKRLKEVDGVDGWREQLARAAKSQFLTGNNDRGFVAGFDFFCQQKSFTKLREGAYDDRKPCTRGAEGTRNRANGGRSIEDDLRDIGDSRGWSSGSEGYGHAPASAGLGDFEVIDGRSARPADHRTPRVALVHDVEVDRDGRQPQDDLASLWRAPHALSR